jgi:hypothetical protein
MQQHKTKKILHSAFWVLLPSCERQVPTCHYKKKVDVQWKYLPCTIPKTSKSKDTSLFGVDICPPNRTLSNKTTTKCVVPMDIKNRNMKATNDIRYKSFH